MLARRGSLPFDWFDAAISEIPRYRRPQGPLPGFIEPALATSIEKVPSGERWLHEIKFDGYRVQVHLEKRRSRYSPGAVMTGPSASRRSPTKHGISTPGPQSSTAR